jgi:hypothetical protein
MTLDMVKRDLGHLQAVFFEIVRGSLVQFFKDHGLMRKDYDLSLEAHIVNTLMRSRAKRLLGSIDGVRFVESNNQFLPILYDSYILKLKKLNAHLLSSSQWTQVVIDFKEQQYTLANLGPLKCLELGYRRHRKTIELSSCSVHIVSPLGEGIEWNWELEAPAMGTAVRPIKPNMPLDPRQRKTKAKDSEKEARRETDGERGSQK